MTNHLRRRLAPGLLAALACLSVSQSCAGTLPAGPAFRVGTANSAATRDIEVAYSSVWTVRIGVIHSAAQLESFKSKVYAPTPRPGGGEVLHPVQHIHLRLTVSRVDRDSSEDIRDEEIRDEQYYGGGQGFGLIDVTSLHLEQGHYRVTMKILEPDPDLSEFETRLIVGMQWK
jgi:hypothetical protein